MPHYLQQLEVSSKESNSFPLFIPTPKDFSVTVDSKVANLFCKGPESDYFRL